MHSEHSFFKPFKIILKVRKKAKIRNQYNQVPHLTKDTIWESDKSSRKHHIQESQEVNPFPAGGHMAVRNNRQTRNTYKKKDP